uniref:histidine kinase n=1 Tax=Geobacter sp. (strain M21) TaxID=443144 RepID=C6E1G4_GEOSM
MGAKQVMKMPSSLQSFARQVIATTLLINLIVLGVTLWSLRDSRMHYEERITLNTVNLSLVLEKYLNGVMEKVNLTLLALGDEVEQQLTAGRLDGDRLNAQMKRQLSRLPEVDGIRMTDAQGRVIYGTGMTPGAHPSVADRDYFHYLRSNPTAGLVISKPLISHISGKNVVVVGRRINRSDHSFGGVIYVAIIVEHFATLFSTINVGPHGAITLTDTKSIVIARSPVPGHTGSYLGKELKSAGLKKLIDEGLTVGSYRSKSALDGVQRTITFRVINGYPLLVFVGMAPSDYLHEWRLDALKMGGLVVSFMLISIITSRLIYERRKREKLAEAELYQHKVYLESIVVQRTSDLETRNRELQESEGVLKTILDNVYDAIVIHDASGRILQVNRRWREMYGVSENESETLTIADFSTDPPPPEELASLWGHVLAGNSNFFEWPARRPHDGSKVWVEAFLCPIRLKEQNLIMGCVRDITERKATAQELQKYRNHLEDLVQERTEELARAVEKTRRETEQRIAAVEELRQKERLLIQQSRLAAMGEMMGNIAHQWRQPLNILGLIVQELQICHQKGTLDNKLVNTLVPKAMKVIAHMSQTIDDFRNLLSPDTSRTVFSVNEVVERVLSIMILEAKVDVIAEEECFAEGARNEFSQVIINVLANANDIFRERQVSASRIIIRILPQDLKSVVTIADNGGGIPEEIMCKIFDPYFTTKAPDRGTGIGLFMSKTIIEQRMKGALSARNTAEGAEFRIEVPAGTKP